jgi:hypothetical protein
MEFYSFSRLSKTSQWVSDLESGDGWTDRGTWYSENKRRPIRLFFVPETSVKGLYGLILSIRLHTLINGRSLAINKYYVTARSRGAPSL